MLNGDWPKDLEKIGPVAVAFGAILIYFDHLAAIVVGSCGIALFLVGVVFSRRRPDAEPETSSEISTSDYLANEYASLYSKPTTSPPMMFYGPSSWYPWFGSKQPDVTFRVGIAIPGVLPQRGSLGETVSQLHGEERESVIENVLNNSPITQWLREQRSVWHWEDDPSWHAYGSGYPESTEYRFTPSWNETLNEVYPLSARTTVNTGNRNEGGPAIHVCCDVFVNLLRLDSGRRIINDWKDTGEIPALAAFQLSEASDMLLHLWPIIDVAATLAPVMLPTGDYSQGEVGMWFAARSVSLGRAVDLSGIKRLDGSGDSTDPWMTTKWPKTEDGDMPNPRELIVGMFKKMLEDSGYRGLNNVLADFRAGGAT